MAISVNWFTGVITVPQADLTLISGTTYELDLDTFRLALKDLEDDEAGMPWPKTHNHNTQVTLSGITFARQIEILFPYTVEFEDGVYGVNLVGANSNIPDVLVRNSVSVNSQNSAGLIVTTVGGVDQATVQAAMTAQGYTTTRAPKLDNLDVAVSSLVGAGLTSAQATMMLELYRLMGLDPTKPLVVQPTGRTAGAEIEQTYVKVGEVVTVTRS